MKKIELSKDEAALLIRGLNALIDRGMDAGSCMIVFDKLRGVCKDDY